MNKTSTLALAHLLKKGYKKEDIILSKGCPTFVTNDGKTFDAKFLYSDSTIVFHEKESNNYDPNTHILLFRQQDVKPYKIIQWKNFFGKAHYKGLKIVFVVKKNKLYVELDDNIKKSLKIYMAERGIDDEAYAIKQVLFEFFTA